jgi:hypothetical protein
MTSTFSWLDYSEEARRRAVETINLFSEHETRDELGLAPLRDGFAGVFSPGTSTIQTRAKYFLLIPWLYAQLAGHRSTRPAKQRMRKAELALIEGLLGGEDHEGLIGREARAELKRTPSGIYWQGLHTWGIRLLPVAQTSYEDWIDHGIAQLEDTSEEGEPVRGVWHAGLPSAPNGFPSDVSLTLNAEQADYLVERIVRRKPHSLLAWLLNDSEPIGDVALPWLHPGIEHMPDQVQSDLDHARCFSELMHGAQLLYNLALWRLRAVDDADAESLWTARVEAWEETIANRSAELAAWPLAAFWNRVDAIGARPSDTTRRFCDNWIEHVRAGSGAGGVANGGIYTDLVRRQEIDVKRGQARFENRSLLAAWGGDSGSGQLNYRWFITRSLVSEIREARDA